MNNIKTVMSIAGSDSSGGAGIQADIKTILVNGGYAMTAVTALTAQNTQGVADISPVTPEFLKAQLEANITDIFPDAVKIGMIFGKEQVLVIKEVLEKYNIKNIVLDPVMTATSGANLTTDETVLEIVSSLFPLSALITPNLPEGAQLLKAALMHRQAAGVCSEALQAANNILGKDIAALTDKDICIMSKLIGDFFCVNVLLKGGHKSSGGANDCLYFNGKVHIISGKRIANPNTHGTGCTLSSAIATNLAKGMNIKASVISAKAYVSEILTSDINLGKRSGPLNHGHTIRGKMNGNYNTHMQPAKRAL